MNNSRHPLDSLIFDDHFFEDEVREGFLVTTMMKRFWAAQLTVLKEIDAVCTRHGLKWFADYGTLIGAVRHGGYIPWDDDLDICMLREDYNKFFAFAKDELPKEYCLLNIQIEKEYRNSLGRVTNSHGIDTGNGHMVKYHGCPYSVGVDIFPMDNLSEDEDYEDDRIKRGRLICDAATMLDSGKAGSSEFNKLLLQIEHQNNVTIDRKDDLKRQLLLVLDKIYVEYGNKESKYISMMYFWVLHKTHKYERSFFSDVIKLPFENTYINAPACYEEVLKEEYGDFMKIYKDGGIHDYPVFKDQEAIFRSALGRNPYRFTITPDSPFSVRSEGPLPLKAQCEDTISMLYEVHDTISAQLSAGNEPAALSLLAGCQDLAVSLGTLIEQKLENGTDVVKLLESYCELAYHIYQAPDAEGVEKMNAAVSEIEALLSQKLSGKMKEILFLPCKSVWWDTLRPCYEKYRSDTSNAVYVLPVPYEVCDDYRGGQSPRPESVPFNVPGVKTVTLDEYDLRTRRPDVIVTQNPYDEWSTVFKVPEAFYARNLVNFTDKLVYVPYFDAGEIGENQKAAAALSVLVEQPAVLYSDEIIVDREELKTLYTGVLKKLTGKNEELIASKIIVMESGLLDTETERTAVTVPEEIKEAVGTRKMLLFHIDASFVLEHGEKAIEKMTRSFETIKDASDALACIYVPHENLTQIHEKAPDLYASLKALTDKALDDHTIILSDTDRVKEYLPAFQGYYGTTGNLAHECRNLMIPVMIMNPDV